MTCDACDIAEQNIRTGRYNAGCPNCEARGLAQSPHALEAYVYGRSEALKGAMRATFPTVEAYRVGRLAVHSWFRRLHDEDAA